MGYHTYYNLCITENRSGKTYRDIIAELREACEMANYSFNKDGDSTCSAKWYDHEEDIAMFSRKNPGVVFELFGDGEDIEDTWYKYFKDGKMQYCPVTIEYDLYDENKLTEWREDDGRPTML